MANYFTYPDNGCRYCNSCLNCTLDVCKLDIEDQKVKDDGPKTVSDLVTSKKSVNSAVKSIINKKYVLSPEAQERAIERARKYKRDNKEKVYAINAQYRASHREVVKKCARKWARLKQLKEGTVKVAGIALLNGRELTLYKAKKNYWYYINGEYGEVPKDDAEWRWIKRA